MKDERDQKALWCRGFTDSGTTDDAEVGRAERRMLKF